MIRQRHARLVIKARWPIIASWLAAAVASAVWLPAIDEAGSGSLGTLVPTDSEAVETEESAAALFRLISPPGRRDLRSPDARDAAPSAQAGQDHRSPDARDAPGVEAPTLRRQPSSRRRSRQPAVPAQAPVATTRRMPAA